MSKDPVEPTIAKESRRSFLAKLGVGAVALAAISFPFARLAGRNSEQTSAATDQFPGEDSIFHPARDPRLNKGR